MHACILRKGEILLCVAHVYSTAGVPTLPIGTAVRIWQLICTIGPFSVLILDRFFSLKIGRCIFEDVQKISRRF